MLNIKKSRLANKVNAGSMADIAFLLLIFFLVTTTIDAEKGIRVLLPPWQIEDKPISLNDSNIFNVKINAGNELLVEQKLTNLEELRQRTKEFIRTQGEKHLPGVISLQNDRGTNYEMYLAVYDRIKGAYDELWEDIAQQKYHKAYKSLKQDQRNVITDQYPLVISEAEPTGHGLE